MQQKHAHRPRKGCKYKAIKWNGAWRKVRGVGKSALWRWNISIIATILWGRRMVDGNHNWLQWQQFLKTLSVDVLRCGLFVPPVPFLFGIKRPTQRTFGFQFTKRDVETTKHLTYFLVTNPCIFCKKSNSAAMPFIFSTTKMPFLPTCFSLALLVCVCTYISILLNTSLWK